VLGLYPLVPLLSALIPESCGMLVELSWLLGLGTALLLVSVGVVGYAPLVVSVGVAGDVGAALVVSVGVGLVGAMDVSLGWVVDVVSKPPVVVSVRTAVVSPRSGAAPISSSPRLWQAASVAAAASM
jgi:hypothetical protein